MPLKRIDASSPNPGWVLVGEDDPKVAPRCPDCTATLAVAARTGPPGPPMFVCPTCSRPPKGTQNR